MERVFGERYEVEALIGAGGMAEVWRGHDRVLNRTVAIKTLLPQFASDASFVDRFRREAQAAARLNHPGIVSVYDSGTDDGTSYIVMQYIEGLTLADYLAAGRTLPPMQAGDGSLRLPSSRACGRTAVRSGACRLPRPPVRGLRRARERPAVACARGGPGHELAVLP